MVDWRNALQSNAMKNVVIGIVFANGVGGYALHVKSNQQIIEENDFAPAPAATPLAVEPSGLRPLPAPQPAEPVQKPVAPAIAARAAALEPIRFAPINLEASPEPALQNADRAEQLLAKSTRSAQAASERVRQATASAVRSSERFLQFTRAFADERANAAAAAGSSVNLDGATAIASPSDAPPALAQPVAAELAPADEIAQLLDKLSPLSPEPTGDEAHLAASAYPGSTETGQEVSPQVIQ